MTPFEMARKYAVMAIEDAMSDDAGLFEVFEDEMIDEIAEEVQDYLVAIRKQVQQMDM